MLLVKGAVINGKYTNCYNNEANYTASKFPDDGVD
jgi:hypothetical protein